MKGPSNIKECVQELIYVIEEIDTLNTNKEKSTIIHMVVNELVAFLKLKEWVNE